jgi:hypothetical protein
VTCGARIPDYLKGIHEECLTAILAIEEHGAEMSPAAWQQVRNARSIRRLVQDILLCALGLLRKSFCFIFLKVKMLGRCSQL